MVYGLQCLPLYFHGRWFTTNEGSALPLFLIVRRKEMYAPDLSVAASIGIAIYNMIKASRWRDLHEWGGEETGRQMHSLDPPRPIERGRKLAGQEIGLA